MSFFRRSFCRRLFRRDRGLGSEILISEVKDRRFPALLAEQCSATSNFRHLSSITCVVHAAGTAPCRLLTSQGSTKRAELKAESNKRIRFFSDDEEQRLFATVPQEYHSPILLALHTGMRKGEMLNLKWEGVDLKRKRLTIRESKAGEARHEP